MSASRRAASPGYVWHAWRRCWQGAVGVVAGILAGSIALVAFGLNSPIEGLASIIVIWRFTGSRISWSDAERLAQKWVAIRILSARPLCRGRSHRDADRRCCCQDELARYRTDCWNSSYLPVAWCGETAHGGEAQNLLCAILAGAALVGLAANTLFGLWWLDPSVALLIAGKASSAAARPAPFLLIGDRTPLTVLTRQTG